MKVDRLQRNLTNKVHIKINLYNFGNFLKYVMSAKQNRLPIHVIFLTRVPTFLYNLWLENLFHNILNLMYIVVNYWLILRQQILYENNTNLSIIYNCCSL